MLKQARSMLGRTEIGARVGPTNLSNRILEVALEVHARTHFVHQFNIHRRFDDTAPARNQQAALALERTERRGLELAKTILALGLKNLGYRLAATAHDQTVGIDKTPLEHGAHVARKRRLARAQKADKEDMVAAVFDVLGHDETYSSQGRSRRARRSKIRKICVYHRSCVACGFTRMVSTPAKLPLHTSV